MAVKGLRQRCYGYELSGIEYTLIFEKENLGFVRYADARRGVFYLDPSLFKDDPRNELYICENLPYPPANKLIEVTVRETEHVPVFVKNQIIGKTTKKYVSGWELRDPNILKCNRLMTKDDFIWNFAAPFDRRRYDTENIATCMALYMVSSPKQTVEFPGGMNTVVIGRKAYRSGWAAFKNSMGVVPHEFKIPGSRFYYTNLENHTTPTPTGSLEVSRAYNDERKVPVDIPIAFDEKIAPAKFYKDSMESWRPMAIAYVLDAHMFQPEISESLTKTISDAMQEILDRIGRYRGNLPYRQDFGSIAPVIGSAVARLNFKSEVKKDDVMEAINRWLESVDDVYKKAASDQYKNESVNLTIDAMDLLADLRGMRDIGVPLTIDNLKKNTKVFEWRFDDAFNELRIAGEIIVMSGGRIVLVKD